MNQVATTYEPSTINLYMQQAFRPISRRYFYSDYVNSLPVKPTDKILEFGSGIGVMAELLARRLYLGQLTCVDISKRYISRAKRNLRDYPNTTFVRGQLTKLNFSTRGFDAINLHYVLHDVPEASRQELIDEMYGLLRPGGKVFLREPLNESHGIPSANTDVLFASAGFVKESGNERRGRFMRDNYSACYIKAKNIRFFFI
ncbi:MAG: class I SAM-dependent methyltransferase [Prolixibacteraceae bacterium]|nr:class I SAM-dependent methyltransferase [Prolixibacteraceae bacterium]